MSDWAPWINDPDDPADTYMTEAEMRAAARRATGLTVDYDPEQPRADKGSPNGGQWVKEGSDVSWTKSGMTKESRQKALDEIQNDLSKAVHVDEDDQPTNDPDELIAMANAAAESFTDAIAKIAQMVGGRPVFPPKGPVKGKDRIIEKATLEYGGKVSEVKDMLRATIETDTIEDARIAATTFIARMGENVLRVKDRIMQQDRGYRDILINFRAENGVVSEVQFNAMPMIKAKQEDGHSIYEELRANPNMDPAKVKTLTERMDEIYKRAYDEAGDSKWLRSKGQ